MTTQITPEQFFRYVGIRTENSHGGEGMNYEQRELMKAAAWKILNSDSASIGIKASALLDVIESHYWRAREHLEGCKKPFQRKVHGKRYSTGYELDIDVYTCHWLFAQNGKFPVASEVFQQVTASFFYKPLASKFLRPGCTVYCEVNEK